MSGPFLLLTFEQRILQDGSSEFRARMGGTYLVMTRDHTTLPGKGVHAVWDLTIAGIAKHGRVPKARPIPTPKARPTRTDRAKEVLQRLGVAGDFNDDIGL